MSGLSSRGKILWKMALEVGLRGFFFPRTVGSFRLNFQIALAMLGEHAEHIPILPRFHSISFCDAPDRLTSVPFLCYVSFFNRR